MGASSGSGPAPLAGIRVVEVCQVLSGPVCAMQLADLGADVVKIENPRSPDFTRSQGETRNGQTSYFYIVNRGKRSLGLDATVPEGRALLARLVDGADVVVQNMRPGKAAALGIGPDECLARNPSLVYASISGFGATGPAAGEPVYDYVIQGVTGMVDLQRDPASAKADLVRNFVADKVTSQATVQAILAALMARERDPERRGQHVEVSMLEAVLSFFWVDGMMLHTLVDEPEATMAYPGDYYRVYPTTDGAVIVMPVMPPFDGICRAAGHPEWIDDPRWADPEERYRNMAAFTDVLAEAIAPFSTAEITAAMNAEDVPVGQVVALERVHEHPQIRAMGSVVEHEVPYLGRVRQARPAWRFGRTPAVVHAGAPQVGDHTDEILAELGLEAAEIEALRASGALA